ncbi:MAG: hypothetical protein IJE90_08725 [Clostridia bacterium]|nr:hypothetical protein [Clostridia bacterium]
MTDVKVIGGQLEQAEIDAYISHVKEGNPGKVLKYLNIKLDGEFVDLEYEFLPQKFQRIRRITGYLVGDMSRWNDAKTAEEKDRVKHTV